MGKLYIAYGSNLNLAQMAARCPSASIYAAGLLNNWELIYRGTQTNSHATIRRKKGSFVPVLVWEIQPRDEARLDIYEGYPRYYFKRRKLWYTLWINGSFPAGHHHNTYTLSARDIWTTLLTWDTLRNLWEKMLLNADKKCDIKKDVHLMNVFLYDISVAALFVRL